MKTRPHDVEQARAEEAAHRAAASALHFEYSSGWFAEFNLLQLEATAALGLWGCYDGFGTGWQSDFWASLPWSRPALDEAVALILQHPRFGAVKAALLAEYGFDLDLELRQGLEVIDRLEAEGGEV
jgi:hypothetical protein